VGIILRGQDVYPVILFATERGKNVKVRIIPEEGGTVTIIFLKTRWWEAPTKVVTGVQRDKVAEVAGPLVSEMDASRPQRLA
jgi:hypothetical protein